MAQLVSFIRDDPPGEYVVIDDEDQDDLGLINDYGLQGYELFARLDLGDLDVSSFPTQRCLHKEG